MIGAHASFLFKPFENIDLGLGVEVRRGVEKFVSASPPWQKSAVLNRGTGVP